MPSPVITEPVKAEWLIEKACRGPTLAWVAEAADIVFVMVTDSRALEAVARAGRFLEGLGTGKTVIDMSTVAAATSQALAREARERGAALVDAPVSGSVQTGGKPAVDLWWRRAPDFERVRRCSRISDLG
jgi:3-hydroxyisobutyrate dehydrogenase-like beta-hydroxyacid dehydrogenase